MSGLIYWLGHICLVQPKVVTELDGHVRYKLAKLHMKEVYDQIALQRQFREESR